MFLVGVELILLVLIGDFTGVLLAVNLKDGELFECEVPNDKFPPSRSGAGELEPVLISVCFFLPLEPPSALSSAGEPVALLLSESFLRGMDFPMLRLWEGLEVLDGPSDE